MAKKSKLNLINDDLTWNADRRYKVNSVVQLNGEDYQNITGKNSNPELLIDWQKIYTDIAISDVTGLPTALDDLQLNKEDKSNKNIANGYAGLDSSGKINPIQLPTLAITETFVVGSESAMLSLVAEVGDVAVRTDLNKSFILRVTGASTLANWQELLSPTSVDQTIIDGSTNAVSGNAVFDALDLKLNISDLPTNLTGYELKSNKQNSLSVDGTGVKYVTVDAVNTNVVNKADTEGIRLDNTITPIYAWGDSLTGGAGQVPYPTALQSQTFFSVTNKGYPSESSTQIKDRMLSEPSNYSKSVVIWIGRNNYNAPNIVKADIATMVSALGHTRYLIVGIINGDYATEYAGQAGWLVINQLNADLKALYGKRFVDIRPYLVSLKTNSAQDLIDFANDVPPASLRIDPLHLTSLGYEKVSSFINKSLGILYQNEAYFQSKDFKYYFESNLPLHTFGNETKTGILTFSNSGTTQINGLVLNNTGTTSTANSIYVNNSSSGRGIYTLNTSTGQGQVLDNFSTGHGLFVNNILTGRGISVDNTSTGRGITTQNTSTGRGFSSDNSAGGQGFYSNNTSTGFGIYSANASTGRGISNDNNSTGFGYYSNNASTGIGMFLNSKTDSTGDILQFAKNGTVTSKFDQNGILTSPSPILTGIPVAPTATAGTNTTQIATTAFVTGADAGNVKLTGAQTVSGVKTFSSSPIVPTAVNANEAVNKGQLDAVFDGLATKATLATIAQIRALSGTLPNNYFYTTNIGQEGNWYFDNTDTTTSDNTGTVLVTADGKRIKRVYSESVNVKWFGAKGDGITDDLIPIQKAFAYSKIIVPEGVYVLSNYTNIGSNRSIEGVRGKSVFLLKEDTYQMFQILYESNISLKYLTFKGSEPDVVLSGGIPMPVAGKVDSYSDALNQINIGTGTGLGIYQGEKINIVGCEFRNFGAWGIRVQQSGNSFEYGIKLTDNYFHDNYIGLELSAEAEYSSYLGNSFTRNQIGVYQESGNNIFTNNHLDKNRVGLVLAGGYNNAHGSFGQSSFNHNALFGVIIDSVTNGESFEGCQFWYGNIYIKNSSGINLQGGLVGLSSILIEGGGQNLIQGIGFSGGNINENWAGSTSNVISRDNFNLDGSDTSLINNTSYISKNVSDVKEGSLTGNGGFVSPSLVTSSDAGFKNGASVLSGDSRNWRIVSDSDEYGRLSIQKSSANNNFDYANVLFINKDGNVHLTAPTPPVGTNTTQIATTAFVQAAARPYKVYTALLSQIGNDAPTATVLENILGGTVVWSRTGTGVYTATLNGAFPLGKTTVMPFFGTINGGVNLSQTISGVRIDNNSVGIRTSAGSTLTDVLLLDATIEIRVYS